MAIPIVGDVRFHIKFPNVPLTRTQVTHAEAGNLTCDVTDQRAQLGDVLWSNRRCGVNIFEAAMPGVDVRYHPTFPGVPLSRGHAPPGCNWVCDVTNKAVEAGVLVWSNRDRVMWSKRDRDVDVLDEAMPTASGGGAPLAPPAPDSLPAAIAPRRGASPRTATEAGASPRTATEAINVSGLELLHGMSNQAGGKSVFVSPLNIGIALAMTANGARGATLEAMLSALGASGIGGIQPLNSGAQSLTSVLASDDPRVTFHVANSVWSRTLKDTFLNICAREYNAEAIRGAPEAAPINKWCEGKTQGRISQVLDPQKPLDPDGAVLVNAIYFKGAWREAFDPRSTKPADFRSASGLRPCQMMAAKGANGKFRYAETDSYQAVALPYGDLGAYCAVVILPRETARGTSSMRCPASASRPRASSVAQVLAAAARDWHGLSGMMTEMKGTVRLPRFKAEFGADLKPFLMARGMQIAFGGLADFGEMSDERPMIDAVVHKTFVEVNEEGMEAAAVTAGWMSRGLARSKLEPEFTMTCDRPFLFLIRHDPSNAIVFAGTVAEV